MAYCCSTNYWRGGVSRCCRAPVRVLPEQCKADFGQRDWVFHGPHHAVGQLNIPGLSLLCGLTTKRLPSDARFIWNRQLRATNLTRQENQALKNRPRPGSPQNRSSGSTTPASPMPFRRISKAQRDNRHAARRHWASSERARRT